jgi:hypothetical protein
MRWPSPVQRCVRALGCVPRGALLALVAAKWLAGPGGVGEGWLVIVIPVDSGSIEPMLAMGRGPTLPADAGCPACASSAAGLATAGSSVTAARRAIRRTYVPPHSARL